MISDCAEIIEKSPNSLLNTVTAANNVDEAQAILMFWMSGSYIQCPALLPLAYKLLLAIFTTSMNKATFTFTRLRYRSGDWDTDQRMPVNILNSLIEYTTIPVTLQEKVVDLSSNELFEYPFCYISGHKLVQFDAQESANFKKYVQNGGFVFADDCNHDIDGLFAKSFETQMGAIFGNSALKKIPNNHPIYRSFFTFEKGPPNTGFELNGWGDDLIHDYLKAIEVNGRIGVLYSNKDYGCEWDYDFRNKRFLAEDNTKFGVNIIMYALNS